MRHEYEETGVTRTKRRGTRENRKETCRERRMLILDIYASIILRRYEQCFPNKLK